MEQYKNLDIDVITKTLADLFNNKEDKWPMGIKHHGNGIYSISSGKSIIYTTEAGVEEFNKLLKEDVKNHYEDICSHPNIKTDGGGDYCDRCGKRW